MGEERGWEGVLGVEKRSWGWTDNWTVEEGEKRYWERGGEDYIVRAWMGVSVHGHKEELMYDSLLNLRELTALRTGVIVRRAGAT